jgi:hypothetical protein
MDLVIDASTVTSARMSEAIRSSRARQRSSARCCRPARSAPGWLRPTGLWPAGSRHTGPAHPGRRSPATTGWTALPQRAVQGRRMAGPNHSEITEPGRALPQAPHVPAAPRTTPLAISDVADNIGLGICHHGKPHDLVDDGIHTGDISALDNGHHGWASEQRVRPHDTLQPPYRLTGGTRTRISSGDKHISRDRHPGTITHRSAAPPRNPVLQLPAALAHGGNPAGTSDQPQPVIAGSAVLPWPGQIGAGCHPAPAAIAILKPETPLIPGPLHPAHGAARPMPGDRTTDQPGISAPRLAPGSPGGWAALAGTGGMVATRIIYPAP